MDVLETKSNAKKVEHKHNPKKVTNIQADTLRIKKWENGSLLLLDGQGEEM